MCQTVLCSIIYLRMLLFSILDLRCWHYYSLTGKENIIWPGLTVPVLRGRELVQRQKLPEDPEREKKLIKLRDDMGHFRPLKLSPIERGWSGTKMPGRSIGPPDPVGEGRNTGLFSVIYFDPFCMILLLLPGSYPLKFISMLALEVSRVPK